MLDQDVYADQIPVINPNLFSDTFLDFPQQSSYTDEHYDGASQFELEEVLSELGLNYHLDVMSYSE